MAIYEPILDGYGIYGSLGKDFPAMPNQRFFKPGGRFGGIVQGAYTIGRHLFKNRKFYTKVGSLGAGYAVSNASNARTNRQQKAFRTTNQYNNRFRRYSKRARDRGGHCSCCC